MYNQCYDYNDEREKEMRRDEREKMRWKRETNEMRWKRETNEMKERKKRDEMKRWYIIVRFHRVFQIKDGAKMIY